MIWVALLGWVLAGVFAAFTVAFMRLAEEALEMTDEALEGWDRALKRSGR